MQGLANQAHSLTERINAAICSMWTNAGELPGPVSKWHTHAELTYMVQELNMRQVMFILNAQSPDDECFTGSM